MTVIVSTSLATKLILVEALPETTTCPLTVIDLGKRDVHCVKISNSALSPKRIVGDSIDHDRPDSLRLPHAQHKQL